MRRRRCDCAFIQRIQCPEPDQLEERKRYRQSKSVVQAMQSERQPWLHGFGMLVALHFHFVVGESCLFLCWSLLPHCQLQKQIGKQELHGSTMEYRPLRQLHSIPSEYNTTTDWHTCPQLVVLRDGLEVIKQEVDTCAKEVV